MPMPSKAFQVMRSTPSTTAASGTMSGSVELRNATLVAGTVCKAR